MAHKRHQTNQKERPIALDLFAGAGGMSLGFEQAGFDIIAAVEIDPIHCATHEFNFPETKIICQSITKLTGREIREKVFGDPSLKKGKFFTAFNTGKVPEIDVIFGGPPCQGFSLIGKRVLEDDRNSLVFHFVRLVLELQPKYFVMENVPGMATGKSHQLLLEVISKFQHYGYQVVEDYQILNAACYGVPQNRSRLFLLGCRDDQKLPKYPQFLTKPAKAQGKYNQLNLPLSPTVWDAIQDLPEIELYPELAVRDWVQAQFGEPSLHYGKYLRCLDQLVDDFSYQREYNSSILTASLTTNHTPESRERFAATRPGKTELISRFYKLDRDGICNTLRAGTATNHGAHTSPRPIHPISPRCITVREAARLHSYPDWFRFHVTKWHGFRQIGNSVPPLLAKAVGSEIIKALTINPQKPLVVKGLGDENLLKFDMTEAADYYQVDRHVIEPRIRKEKGKKNQDE